MLSVPGAPLHAIELVPKTQNGGRGPELFLNSKRETQVDQDTRELTL